MKELDYYKHDLDRYSLSLSPSSLLLLPNHQKENKNPFHPNTFSPPRYSALPWHKSKGVH